MILICSWCKQTQGVVGNPQDLQETHGICVPCHTLAMEEAEEALATIRRLDELKTLIVPSQPDSRSTLV